MSPQPINPFGPTDPRNELFADALRWEMQGREHAAWLDVGQEFAARKVDVNDGSWSTLIYAIRKWGEELHQLRLADPEHDESALRDARADYEGQWERGTYPEKLRSR